MMFHKEKIINHNFRNTSTIIKVIPDLINNFELLFDLISFDDKVNHFIITDLNLDYLYSEKFFRSLSKKINLKKIVIPPEEKYKSIETFKRIVNLLLDMKVDKKSYIISFGGGLVNNIAGFVSSTLFRGLNLIHFPTTLLAQVDAAIDFKQAVNYKNRKNIIGSIYPADLILIDPTVLQTLPKTEINQGFAEIIKHSLTQDINLYKKLTSNDYSSNEKLYSLIEDTIELKSNLLNTNPEYADMIMQYGHLIGHSIESLSEYKINHGFAISIGMCITAEISHLYGYLSKQELLENYGIFKLYNLPTLLPKEISFEDLWLKMKQDKYADAETPKCGLLSSIGSLKQNEGSYEFFVQKKDLREAMINNRERLYEICYCNRCQ